MKKFSLAILVIALTAGSIFAREDIQELGNQTDALWRPGAAAIDGAYTSLSMSMLGWGLGLATGFGILIGVLHNSKASHNHCD
jgi:hypothetical protein